MGFVHVESGPLVRSSYHAHETADAYAAAAADSRSTHETLETETRRLENHESRSFFFFVSPRALCLRGVVMRLLE